MAERRKDENVLRPDFSARAARTDGAAPASGGTDWRARFVEGLYRDHWRGLCQLMRRMFGEGPPEPEDLVQGAFQKFSALENVDHIDNPRAFIAKVAINDALKSIGRVQRAHRYVAEQLNRPGQGLEEIDPERIYRGREDIRAIDRAMATLTPKQREIVVRSRLRGETYAQISRSRGWSEADISRQLNRALKILAEAVAPADRNAHDQ